MTYCPLKLQNRAGNEEKNITDTQTHMHMHINASFRKSKMLQTKHLTVIAWIGVMD